MTSLERRCALTDLLKGRCRASGVMRGGMNGGSAAALMVGHRQCSRKKRPEVTN
jgi:hypothetical protein